MTVSEGKNPRILLVKSRGRIEDSGTDLGDSELREKLKETGQKHSGSLLERSLACDILDELSVRRVPGIRGKFYSFLPEFMAQAIEARVQSRNYDVVISWSEKHSVAVASIFAMSGARTPHLAMMFWLSKGIVKFPLTIFRAGIDCVVTWSSIQAAVATEKIGFEASRVRLVKHPVDTSYYHPINTECSQLFSAGSTLRDFDTLAEAVEGLAMPVRIGASIVVTLKGLRAQETDVRTSRQWPSNISVDALKTDEVRQAYSKAAIVVVPLLPSDIDAGVNVILEAMAMGRPVVVSRTEGQVDVVVEGSNAVFVTPQSPVQLREVIDELLAEPEKAEAMGERARIYVEENHKLEDFIEKIRAIAIDTSAETVRRRFIRTLPENIFRLARNIRRP